MRALESAWRNHCRHCVAIVSEGTSADGVTVRFHIRRGGDSWIPADLEVYESDCIAVLESEASDRTVVIYPVALNVPVVGSHNSAEAR